MSSNLYYGIESLPENTAGWRPQHGWLLSSYYCGSEFRSFGQWAAIIATHRLLLLLISTPLRIVNRCCSGFPVNGGRNL